MNPDDFVLFGKTNTISFVPTLFGITDGLDVETFESWSDIHDRKDICCVVRISKTEFVDYLTSKSTILYSVDINDHRGVIPSSEDNCGWVGLSYISAEAALHDALKEFYKTVSFVWKVQKMFNWGVLND